jgi:hypothetical protein
MELYGEEISDFDLHQLLLRADRNETRNILSAISATKKYEAIERIRKEDDPYKRFIMKSMFDDGIYDYSVLYGPDYK